MSYGTEAGGEADVTCHLLSIYYPPREMQGKMVIYVIPEAVLVSKGSNIVVSLLHHFLAKYSLGEKDGAKC